MNSSSRRIQNIIIDSSILAFSSISICISALMSSLIIYRLMQTRESSKRLALILTSNMYCALLLFSILLVEQYAHVLPAHLYLFDSSNDGLFCQIRAYLQLVSVCAIFYSNTLQAIYRLCRVIFYTKPLLRSSSLYQKAIIIQWLACFLMVMPTLLRNDFEYLVDDYHCQITYTNFRSVLVNGILAYIIPMTVTCGCYIYTLRKIKQSNGNLLRNMPHLQQINVRRDLVVLFRICLLVFLLMIFFIPSTIILFIYQFTGYLPWWSSQVQWLVFVVSVTLVTVALGGISPHVYNRCLPIVQRPTIMVPAVIRNT